MFVCLSLCLSGCVFILYLAVVLVSLEFLTAVSLLLYPCSWISSLYFRGFSFDSFSTDLASLGCSCWRAELSSILKGNHHSNTLHQQECIPVGCVLAAHWPYARVCFSGGGLDLMPSISPLGVGLDLIPLNFPLGCGPGSDPPQFSLGCGPGSDPPQFPLLVWAWIWSPSIPPLGGGLDLIPLNFPTWVWAWIWSPSISPLGVDLEEGGTSFHGGPPWQGASFLGGFPAGGPPSWGSITACTEADLPCEQNDKQ